MWTLVQDCKLWIIMMKLRKWFLFQTRCMACMEKVLSCQRQQGLDWQRYYLCFIKVFDTNTVHNGSQRSGLLCLMEKNQEWIYYCWNTGGLKLRTRRQRQWSVERLPLAARWWAGAPAALRQLTRWSRWPGLEEADRPVSIKQPSWHVSAKDLAGSYQSSPGESAHLP